MQMVKLKKMEKQRSLVIEKVKQKPMDSEKVIRRR